MIIRAEGHGEIFKRFVCMEIESDFRDKLSGCVRYFMRNFYSI